MFAVIIMVFEPLLAVNTLCMIRCSSMSLKRGSVANEDCTRTCSAPDSMVVIWIVSFKACLAAVEACRMILFLVGYPSFSIQEPDSAVVTFFVICLPMFIKPSLGAETFDGTCVARKALTLVLFQMSSIPKLFPTLITFWVHPSDMCVQVVLIGKATVAVWTNRVVVPNMYIQILAGHEFSSAERARTEGCRLCRIRLVRGLGSYY